MTASLNGTNPGVNEADWDEMVIGPQEIQALSETKEGREYLKLFFARARTGYGVTQVASYLYNETSALTRPLTSEEMHDIGSILWFAERQAPHAVIQQFVSETAEANNEAVANA